MNYRGARTLADLTYHASRLMAVLMAIAAVGALVVLLITVLSPPSPVIDRYGDMQPGVVDRAFAIGCAQVMLLSLFGVVGWAAVATVAAGAHACIDSAEEGRERGDRDARSAPPRVQTAVTPVVPPPLKQAQPPVRVVSDGDLGVQPIGKRPGETPEAWAKRVEQEERAAFMAKSRGS